MTSSKLGFSASWSMAVGGMVGGGIFSTLGVIIGISGAWAWLSFVVAGLVALLAGYSYTKLASHYGEGGGAFTFLREIHADGFAGSLSWVLIVGYVLTNAVYAFTFGKYLAYVIGGGDWIPRIAAVSVVGLFVVLNLRGAGEASGVEIVLVWFKLVALVGLSAYGLVRWRPELLSPSGPTMSPWSALVGAASVFMAYEGFQLLTYDYDDIEDPDRTVGRAIVSAILAVIVVYVVVSIGVAMLVGADAIIENQEVALALAGKEAAGTLGLVIVTVAAAFSTGSAINSTLFATARLTRDVADAGELPSLLSHQNDSGVPDRAILMLGGLAALLAAIGSLTTLVESASLTFLFTFSVVSGLAFTQRVGRRWITVLGAVGAGGFTVALAVRLFQTHPLTLVVLGVLVLTAVFVRPRVLAGSS